MVDCPRGWRTARLGEIAELFNGKASGTGGTWLRVFKTRHVYDGYLRLAAPTYAPNEKASTIPRATFLRPGDTLTPNMAHGTIGRVAFVRAVEDNWTVDGQIMVIRPNEDLALGRYVYDWMSRRESKQQLVDMEKGGAFDALRGQTHIYKSDVEKIQIVLPPLPEQRKIAAILSSIDEAIDATQAVIEQLQVVKKAMMAELLTRGLPGRHTRFKQTEIGEMPEEWSVRRIDQLGALGSGTTPSRQRHDYFSPNGTPWVKTTDLNDDSILSTEECVTDLAMRETSLRLNPPGTVLVAMYGGFAQIGRTGVLGVAAANNQALCPIRLGSEVYPEFLNVCLVGLRSRWKGIAASSRKDPNITKQDVAAFLVPLPPKHEQLAVVSAVRSVHDRISREETCAAQLRQCKSALSAALLTGEIRVTPDEPDV